MKLIALHHNFKQHNICFSSPLLQNDAYPLVYTLPDTALLKEGRPFFIPNFAQTCTAELHLVVRICRLGRSISERFAHRYYDALTVGITFTAQELFLKCCKEGLPWELSKGFDGAAAIGSMIPLNEVSWPRINFEMKIDGKQVMRGKSEEMIKNVDEIIAYVSKFYTLRQGDLLFMGTPQNPLQVKMNERLSACIEEKTLLTFNVK